ncbi:MAG: phospho-sugar mutase [Solirubrobacteraceae bacterium]
MQNITEKINQWMNFPFDEETINLVKQLQANNPKELEESFYKDLSFGTGGMRGIMGVGTNRLNKYTIGKATQGLANYLNKTFKNELIKVAIAYDVRDNSKEFAEICANILSANNIDALLFDGFRPTPLLSYTVREANCNAGIVITASHNPPEYNGYKVYWQDGSQIVTPHDENILQEISLVNFNQIKFNKQENRIKIIGKEFDDKFYEQSILHANFNNTTDKDLKIVFTPIHGTSVYSIPSILNKAGFNNLHLVKEQMIPSGKFFTVESPNPEEPEALKLAKELAIEVDADIFIGTDPDADRLGVGVKETTGNYFLLTGNQTNTLLVDYLLDKWKTNNKLNGKQFIGTTNVTTDLIIELAKKYQVACLVGLTGFKWIAKMIEDNPTLKFICGGEESYGFLVDDFVRDKDALTTSLLFSEMANELKIERKTPFQRLKEIYVEVGFFKEDLFSLTKKGKEGVEQINKIMNSFRNNFPKEIDGSALVEVQDYLLSKEINLISNTNSKINFPVSDVLTFKTLDGSKLTIRPSGTEPKIKFYISVKTKLNSTTEFNETDNKLKEKIKRIKTTLTEL